MNKDLFALVPNTFEPSLSETFAGIDTFLDLEYGGQLTAEIVNPLTEKKTPSLNKKLVTSLILATTLLLAACTPSSGAQDPKALPYKEVGPIGPYKKEKAAIEVSKQGPNQYLIKITTDDSFDGYTPYYYNRVTGESYTSKSSFKKTNDGSAILQERIDLSKEPLTTVQIEYVIGGGPGAAHVKADLLPDIVIQGVVRLSSLNRLYGDEPIEIDTLYIEKNGVLDTEGEDLQIKANRIVSQGKISSRDKGGHLELKATDLIGSIDLEQSGPVSHPGTLNFLVINAYPMNDESDCGFRARYNAESKEHTSFSEIKNNYCTKR